MLIELARNKKAVNSDLNVPLNEIEPVGMSEKVYCETLPAGSVYAKVPEINKAYDNVFWSLENSNGGKIYEISNLVFRFYHCAADYFNFYIKIDGVKHYVFKKDYSFTSTDLHYKNVINLMEPKNVLFLNYMPNTSNKAQIKSVLTPYAFVYDVSNYYIDNFDHNETSLPVSTDGYKRQSFRWINKYIPFKKKIELGVETMMNTANENGAIQQSIYECYIAYSLNE